MVRDKIFNFHEHGSIYVMCDCYCGHMEMRYCLMIRLTVFIGILRRVATLHKLWSYLSLLANPIYFD